MRALGWSGMQTLRLRAMLAIATLAGCATPIAHHEPASAVSPASGSTVLARLAARLHGSWQAETAPGKRVVESFRTISADSALVETFVTAGGRETASIYHADREALLMTHYCAQGNQPRLQLTSSSEDDYVFRFRDATNLLPEQSCLVEKRLHFVGNKLEQTEVYKASNGSTETTTLHFERNAPAN